MTRNYFKKSILAGYKKGTGSFKLGIQLFYRLKKKALSILLLFLFFNGYSHGNNYDEKKTAPKIKFSGYLKYEMFSDSRQTVNAREGLVALYPKNTFPDENGVDINDVSSINMLSIHSKLTCAIIGPDLLGASSKGAVEADFFGNENKNFSDLNGLRLVTAYMEFDWGATKLLAGQYWHPMSIRGFFPGVVSHGNGAPFHPMARNPQIRITHSIGNLKLVGCLFAQRDYTSTGPDGPGSQYLRNSGIPNLHFRVQFGSDSSSIITGAGLDYKKVVPELFTKNNEGVVFATRNSLTGISLTGFVRIKIKHLSFKGQGVYAQNAFDTRMLGGYAVKKVINVQTGEKEFTNLNTVSVWGDAQTIGKKISLGLFGGYIKNLGAGEIVEGPYYSRGADIGKIHRIAPRIVYSNGVLAISLEGEYTTANYGIANGDGKGGVTNTNPVSNFRTLLSLKYSFL